MSYVRSRGPESADGTWREHAEIVEARKLKDVLWYVAMLRLLGQERVIKKVNCHHHHLDADVVELDGLLRDLLARRREDGREVDDPCDAVVNNERLEAAVVADIGVGKLCCLLVMKDNKL